MVEPRLWITIFAHSGVSAAKVRYLCMVGTLHGGYMCMVSVHVHDGYMCMVGTLHGGYMWMVCILQVGYMCMVDKCAWWINVHGGCMWKVDTCARWIHVQGGYRCMVDTCGRWIHVHGGYM